jgi:Kae1-associated kinase Bud32
LLDPLSDFNPVQGAEAKIDLVDWYGRPAIRKSRIPKTYRIEDIDYRLRFKRTKEEVEILRASKLAGVDCPEVYFADPNSNEIVMEYVRGTLLKDVSDHQPAVYGKLGLYAARLHAAGIVHGDLTTKNVIVAGERMVLIDFGLAFHSERVEDRAEDLHLLKQALKGTQAARTAASNFERTMKGYEEVVGKKKASEVRKQILKIQLRGRYAQVD